MVTVLPATGTSVPTTLLIGLLVAFALQILAAGFYGVIGATWFYRHRLQTDFSQGTSDQGTSRRGSSQGISRINGLKHRIGAVLLLTANGVMVLACYFAVKLSFATSSVAGAILGLVIWSACLVLWMGLIWKGVGMLLGKSMGVLMAVITSILSWLTGQQPPTSLESLRTQMVAQQSRLMDLQQQLESNRVQQTVEQTVAAIRADSQASSQSVQPHPLWQQVEHYISDPSQKLTAKVLRQHLETLVQPFEQIPERLPAFDRQTVEQSLATRLDLSSKRQTRIANRLETVWNELMQQFESNSPAVAASRLGSAQGDAQGNAQDNSQPDLSEAGWLGLVILLVQTSLQSLEVEDWAGDQLNQKRSQILAWVKTGRQKLQQQISQLRQQTRDQIRAMQQTAITLLWWVLATALTSGLTAALAGALAVR